MNLVRLQCDFGQRGHSALVGPDSIRGHPENPKGGAGAQSAPPLATSLLCPLGGVQIFLAVYCQGQVKVTSKRIKFQINVKQE